MQLSEICCLVIWLGLFARIFGDTTVGDIETLDEEQCSKPRKGCCEDINMFMDNETIACVYMFQELFSTSPGEERTLSKSIGALSCVIKCVYKKRNYLVEGDEDINMQGVKEHVEKLYAGRPKEQQYYIEVFEFCRKDVNACRMRDHTMKTCPYFMWAAKNRTSAAQKCKAAKDQCYKIDDLTPPEAKELTLDL
ncbi:uncharacterized protein LOC128922561 [Zeugodacus cucurbitae]|uniref:uncharacterized protein LOC128922561 n=1 Tax=Zeugodacus cucurbitae TaxID=28588 RepID=UPI0023D91DCE|nr:uncharacterized protein LOC128922561 [Zeugodacus cucurbitae]